MKNFWPIFSIVIFFLGGIYINWISKEFPMEEGLSLASESAPGSSRDPAAIKKGYDFSNLEGSALSYASKQRLLNGARVIHDQRDIGIELGHFVIKGTEGNKEFACQHYSRVILQFEGEGVAVGGETPKMEVEGACEISTDINAISALWIPVSRILGEPVADSEFDFREGRPSKVKFANVSDQWPLLWQLQSVKLIDPSGAYGEVSVQPSELREILKKPFLVQF